MNDLRLAWQHATLDGRISAARLLAATLAGSSAVLAGIALFLCIEPAEPTRPFYLAAPVHHSR